MYGYDISNEVSPRVVSTSVQKNQMRSHDLTKFWLIKNFLAKTSHKTENHNFFMKISVLVQQFCVPLLMSETSEYSMNVKFKMIFFSFFLSIDCKELLNIKESLMRRYRHQICGFCTYHKKMKKTKKSGNINFWNCHFSPDFRCEQKKKTSVSLFCKIQS